MIEPGCPSLAIGNFSTGLGGKRGERIGRRVFGSGGEGGGCTVAQRGGLWLTMAIGYFNL